MNDKTVMYDKKSCLGHEGVGGIQKHSCGEVYPWSIVVYEKYLTNGQVPGSSMEERFLFGELWLQHPDGRQVLLADYHRGPGGMDAEGKNNARLANERADRRAQWVLSVEKRLEEMARIMGYGQVKEAVAKTLAETYGIVPLRKPLENVTGPSAVKKTAGCCGGWDWFGKPMATANAVEQAWVDYKDGIHADQPRPLYQPNE